MDKSAKYKKLLEMTHREKYPREFRNLVRDFTVAYLVADPANTIDFGIEYFSKILALKMLPSKNLKRQTLSEESIAAMKIIESRGHREGVFSEIYHPDEWEYDDGNMVDGTKIIKKTEGQIHHLTTAVKHVFAFRILDHHLLPSIIEHMSLMYIKKGEHVMQEGLNADKFFVIERGTFKEFLPSKTTDGGGKGAKPYKLVTGNGYFGHLALHYHHIIPNTVIAEADGELWCIERQTFRRLVLKYNFEKMKQFEETLKEIVLLNELDEDKKMILYDALSPCDFNTRVLIYKEGEEPKGMYFLRFGNVKTYNVDKKGEEINVRYYVKGEYFGEIEILAKKKRAYNAVAVGHIKTDIISAEIFDRVLENCRSQMEEIIPEYEQKVEYLHGVPALLKESGRHNKREKFELI